MRFGEEGSLGGQELVVQSWSVSRDVWGVSDVMAGGRCLGRGVVVVGCPGRDGGEEEEDGVHPDGCPVEEFNREGGTERATMLWK